MTDATDYYIIDGNVLTRRAERMALPHYRLLRHSQFCLLLLLVPGLLCLVPLSSVNTQITLKYRTHQSHCTCIAYGPVVMPFQGLQTNTPTTVPW